MPGLRRALLPTLLAIVAAAPAEAAPRWERGVLSCGGAAFASSAAGTPLVPPVPVGARGARCVSASVPVGVTRDGVAILPATAAVSGPADACGIRRAPSGLPFHRESLACHDRPRTHRRALGWARDGFRIYGRAGARGLDRCHGHAHRVGGRRIYHYHWTPRAPFTVGCFRGRPARWSWGSAVAPPPLVPPPPAVEPPAPPPPAEEPASAPVVEAAPAGGWPSVSTDPPLDPPFDPSIRDYVVACAPPDPVRVHVAAPPATDVRVDGGAATGGTFDRDVELDESQGTTLDVASPAASGTFHVRCLPSWLRDTTIDRSSRGEAAFTIATPLAFLEPQLGTVVSDANATPVWWKAGNAINAMAIPGGGLAWTQWSRGNYSAGSYDDVRPDGSVVRSWTAGAQAFGADMHEMRVLPGGDRLLVVYRERPHVDLSGYGYSSDATVIDGEVQRVTPEGDVVWKWSTSDHVALAESARWSSRWGVPKGSSTVYDIVHINSVEAVGDDIVVSLRHTDAVYRVDDPETSGAVEWKLGGTQTPQRLGVAGDGGRPAEETFGGQHDARVLPDGSVTVFDNRTDRTDATPRAVRFAIDEAAGTATVLEQREDADHAPASGCCGSARKLPAGGWMIYWGGTRVWAEYAADGTTRWRVTLPPGRQSYRVVPATTDELSLDALRAGMDAMHPRP